MKVLLLENIHPIAQELLTREGIQVETAKSAWTEDELIAKLGGYDALGIRSKTYLTEKVFNAIQGVNVVGCFCVGTNQVDLAAARKKGIAVFNAPFSNTRSVAELVIAEIIMLSRKLGTRNNEMHRGIWNKSAEGCFEVRGKTLGIIGYGNIGFQVSMLAEDMGMRVVFYDIVAKLPIGNAKPMSSLEELLKESDFVTLHVPQTNETNEMIGAKEIAMMHPGSCLINASRGSVVNIPALAEALKSKHLGGAAIDVFPIEPEKTKEEFKSAFQEMENVILTPHIGGATEEAQINIGREVAGTLARFLKSASTYQSVNFPELESSLTPGAHRLSNVHKNVPGVLKEINRILSENGANIQGQALKTDAELGYLVVDVDQPVTDALIQKISQLPTSIRTRRVGI